MKPDRARVQHWKRILSPYFGPSNRFSAWQMGYTAVLFAGAWALMYFSLAIGYWLTLILSVPTAGLLMRLFMFQHDCGHGSYFRSRRLACVTGSVIGVLTLTPYHYWRKTHAIHHAHSGDLDLRTFGDIVTITVREYEEMSWMQRLGYRFYRNPVVLFGPGAAFHFLVKHRFPWDVPRRWKREWRSVWWTNAAIAAILATAWLTIGIGPFLMIQLPVTLLACTFGVWLFYVQHQFEDAYWRWHEDWDYYDAALHGSSFLKLPRVLQWFTANIGLHHVHHLSARIPNYRLQRCHDENPELWKAPMMTLWDGLKTLRLSLWDEGRRKLISFREHRRLRTAAAHS